MPFALTVDANNVLQVQNYFDNSVLVNAGQSAITEADIGFSTIDFDFTGDGIFEFFEVVAIL